MSCKDINHPALWGIQHIPSGKLLRQQTKGYGHTQLDVEDCPDSHRAKKGIEMTPRLFTSQETAKFALIMWLRGVHHNYWDDGLMVTSPKVPRYKDDYRVVPIYLYTDVEE